MEEMSRLALAAAGLPSAPFGRWSAPVSEPHCERERASDFERHFGQNLESFVEQGGDFASSGTADFYSRAEELTRVLQGAVFEILLYIGGGLAAQLI